MKSAYWQAGLGVTAAMALAFLHGLGLQLSPPPRFLGWGAWPLLVVLPFVFVMVLLLAATVKREMRPESALQLGALIGSIAAMLFIVGVFSPYALTVGERRLDEFAGEARWSEGPIVWMTLAAMAGAALGAVCGRTVWALKRGFGRTSGGQ